MFNKYLLLFTAVLLLFLGLQQCRIQDKSQKINEKDSITLAITDSLRYYHDRLGREVAEKHGIQASMKSLEQEFALLKPNQQLLVRDIQLLPRQERKNLVAGTSLLQTVTLHTVDSVLVPSRYHFAWRRTSDTLSYAIHVADSTLTIDTLRLPNRISLVHYRDPEKNLHVRATNSNPMFRTQDIDAIVPPEKRKNLLARILAVFVP